MSAFWKVMVGLLLTLPVAAYVTGTLVTSQADLPDRRNPVVISDNPSDGASERPAKRATQQPQDEPPRSTGRPSPRGGGDDGPRAEDNDDDGVRIVRPTPRDVDDDNFDDADDSRDDDDSRSDEGDDDG